jgi:hypothetical protein
LPKREAVDIVPGIIAGAGLGLFVTFWLMPLCVVFPGDLIVLGALVGGLLAYYGGAGFFR